VIAKDVASTFPQSEEEAINKAQQFDLIYMANQITCTHYFLMHLDPYHLANTNLGFLTLWMG
jgi:hypothetical protein